MDLPSGFLIRVKYQGATDTKGARWVATYRRSADQTFRAVLPYESDSGRAAATACLAKVNDDRRAIVPNERDFVLIAHGHDDEAYYYIAGYGE